MKRLLLLLLAFAPALFADDFFIATTSFKIVGKIPSFLLFEKFTTKDLIDNAAAANHLRPSQLVLVLDTTTDSLVIIKKSDGTILGTLATMSGGQTIASDSDNSRVRFADIAFNGTVGATGTIAGNISIKRKDSTITKFVWGATYQGTANFDTGTDSGVVPGIIQGTFISGKRFTPGS